MKQAFIAFDSSFMKPSAADPDLPLRARNTPAPVGLEVSRGETEIEVCFTEYREPTRVDILSGDRVIFTFGSENTSALELLLGARIPLLTDGKNLNNWQIQSTGGCSLLITARRPGREE